MRTKLATALAARGPSRVAWSRPGDAEMPMSDEEFERRTAALRQKYRSRPMLLELASRGEAQQVHYRGPYRVSEMDQGGCGGWLSPDGQYWPCIDSQHQAKVDEIIGSLGVPVVGDPMAWLENRGWIHVMDQGGFATHGGRGERMWGKEPTQAQIDVLWDLVRRFPDMEEGMRFFFDLWEIGQDGES
jgi:hypothetical protein